MALYDELIPRSSIKSLPPSTDSHPHASVEHFDSDSQFVFVPHSPFRPSSDSSGGKDTSPFDDDSRFEAAMLVTVPNFSRDDFNTFKHRLVHDYGYSDDARGLASQRAQRDGTVFVAVSDAVSQNIAVPQGVSCSMLRIFVPPQHVVAFGGKRVLACGAETAAFFTRKWWVRIMTIVSALYFALLILSMYSPWAKSFALLTSMQVQWGIGGLLSIVHVTQCYNRAMTRDLMNSFDFLSISFSLTIHFATAIYSVAKHDLQTYQFWIVCIWYWVPFCVASTCIDALPVAFRAEKIATMAIVGIGLGANSAYYYFGREYGDIFAMHISTILTWTVQYVSLFMIRGVFRLWWFHRDTATLRFSLVEVFEDSFTQPVRSAAASSTMMSGLRSFSSMDSGFQMLAQAATFFVYLRAPKYELPHIDAVNHMIRGTFEGCTVTSTMRLVPDTTDDARCFRPSTFGIVASANSSLQTLLGSPTATAMARFFDASVVWRLVVLFFVVLAGPLLTVVTKSASWIALAVQGVAVIIGLVTLAGGYSLQVVWLVMKTFDFFFILLQTASFSFGGAWRLLHDESMAKIAPIWLSITLLVMARFVAIALVMLLDATRWSRLWRLSMQLALMAMLIASLIARRTVDRIENPTLELSPGVVFDVQPLGQSAALSLLLFAARYAYRLGIRRSGCMTLTLDAVEIDPLFADLHVASSTIE